jgi:hypothetical protein
MARRPSGITIIRHYRHGWDRNGYRDRHRSVDGSRHIVIRGGVIIMPIRSIHAVSSRHCGARDA